MNFGPSSSSPACEHLTLVAHWTACSEARSLHHDRQRLADATTRVQPKSAPTTISKFSQSTGEIFEAILDTCCESTARAGVSLETDKLSRRTLIHFPFSLHHIRRSSIQSDAYTEIFSM